MKAIRIPHFTILGELDRGNHSIVYKAARGDELYVVKLPLRTPEEMDSRDLAFFRREGTMLSCIRHPALARVYEVSQIDGRPYMVQEFVSGDTLETRITGGRLSQDQTAAIGLSIAQALAAVHQRGVIHRDIKPKNILIESKGSAKLIDFGLADRIVRDTEQSDELVGTFLYSAPEQTGILKRPVDQRADLYALGCVLYHCLAGHPPFETQYLNELLRLHMVAIPADLLSIRSDISVSFSRIIAKLLAKDPDDRYQTAESLAADLCAIESLDKSISLGEEVRFGYYSRHLPEEHRLIGRENEMMAIRRAYEERRKIPGCFILISGASGCGKSRIASEFLREVLPDNGLVMHGRCEVHRSVPFAPILEMIDCFQEYLDQAPTHERREIIGAVRSEMRDAAPLLLRLSDKLKFLFPEEQIRGELPLGMDYQFHQTVAELLAAIAFSTDAAIFCDDVHWLDLASMQVMRYLGKLRANNLMVVVTIRDDGEYRNGYETFIHHIEESLLREIHLMPLGLEAIHELISEFLGGSEVDAEAVRRIHDITEGNLLAVYEIVNAMLEAGMMEPHWDTWTWHSDRFEALNLPDNVLSMLAARVSRLGSNATGILNIAAILGTSFDADLLCRISCLGTGIVSRALSESADARMIIAIGNDCYRFLHHGFREALIAAIDPAEKRWLHQRTADVIKRLPIDDHRRNIYALAHHVSMGESKQNPADVFEINYQAGLQALEDYADNDAFSFLMRARKAQQDANVPRSVHFEVAYGKALAATGRMKDARHSLEQALDLAQNREDRIRIRLGILWISSFDLDYKNAWEQIDAIFREFGSRFPHSPILKFFAIIQHAILIFFSLNPCHHVRPHSEHRKVRLEAMVQLCIDGGILSFIAMKPLDIIYFAFLGLSRSLRLGPSRQMAIVLGYWAVLAGFLKFPRIKRRLIRTMNAIANELNIPAVKANILYLTTLSHFFSGNPEKAESSARPIISGRGRWLDIRDFQQLLILRKMEGVLRGYYQPEWSIQDGFDRLHDCSFASAYEYPYSLLELIDALDMAVRGRVTDAVEALERRECPPPGNQIGTDRYECAVLTAYRILILVEIDELDEQLDVLLRQYRDLHISPRLAPDNMRFAFVAQAYAWFARMLQAPVAQRQRFLDMLKKASRELNKAATTDTLRCHAHIIRAALLWFEGKQQKALCFLECAYRLSRKLDSPWGDFEIARLRAHIYRQQGLEHATERELAIGMHIVRKLGWHGRGHKLNREFPGITSTCSTIRTCSLSSDSSTPMPTSTESGLIHSIKLQEYLDALLRVSEASARFWDSDAQAKTALDEIVRVLKAERGFLYIRELSPVPRLRLLTGRDSDGLDLGGREGHSISVVEEVIRTAKSYLSATNEQGAMVQTHSMVTHGIRSSIAAPLRIRDEVLGAIYLDSRLARGVFSKHDLGILEAISNEIALAIKISKMAQLEIERVSQCQRIEKQQLLLGINRELGISLVPGQFRREISAMSAKACEAQRCIIYVVDKEDENRIFPLHLLGAQEENYPTRHPKPGKATEVGECLHIQQYSLLQELFNQKNVHEYRVEDMGIPDTWNRSFGDGYVLCVPLVCRARCIGLLTLFRRPDRFIDAQKDLAQTIGAQLAFAIDNYRLFAKTKELAMIDELTGLYNRRQYFALGEQEFNRFERYNIPLTVMIIDVDHFKDINDRWGHAAGDHILRQIAIRCRESLRKVDVLGRYGGEEFAAVLPGTNSANNGIQIGEQIRKNIAESSYTFDQKEITVTISIGVAYIAQSSTGLLEALKMADIALYRAKELGRNRVEAYNGPGMQKDLEARLESQKTSLK